MDHRGLLNLDGDLITLGGMNKDQQVINKVISLSFFIEQLDENY